MNVVGSTDRNTDSHAGKLVYYLLIVTEYWHLTVDANRVESVVKDVCTCVCYIC